MRTPVTAPTPVPISRAHTEVVHQLSIRAEQDPDAFYAMALRTRSPDVLDAVATLALPGSRARALQDIGGLITDGLDTSTLPSSAPDPHWMSQLAALTAVQVTRSTPDLQAAWGLWQWATSGQSDELPQKDRDLRAQVAWALGQSQRSLLTSWVSAEGLLTPAVRADLRTDLANPWLTDPATGSTPEWERNCQDILGPRLASLQVPSGPGAPLDRLTAPSASAVVGDRSIAVILTTYRPDRSLLTAVSSVVNQTWQEWTLFLVDDASGPEYEDVLDEAVSMDERITLLRTDHNGGTYQARNTALRSVGSADFITFHDSDDWSHPQRLELTVQPLRASSTVVATLARAIKATEDLQLTRLGYRSIARMAASLMFRRDPVFTTLGFFDPVRKSADTEFRRRISAAFPGALAELKVPIAVVRKGQDSLSSADHSRGWRHHSRRHYQQAYQEWHHSILHDNADPYLNDLAARPLWAPARWAPDAAAPALYDVVLAADYSRVDVEECFASHLRAAREGGGRVGLLQVDRPVLLQEEEPSTNIFVLDQFEHGQLDWVYLDDELHVAKVIVLDPGVLHPGTDQSATWDVGQVTLMPPAPDAVLDLHAAQARARLMFGVAAQWWEAAGQD